MGFKCMVIALVFVACLCMTAFAQGPKNILAEPEFPGEDMSGQQIYQEVREVASMMTSTTLPSLSEMRAFLP